MGLIIDGERFNPKFRDNMLLLNDSKGNLQKNDRGTPKRAFNVCLKVKETKVMLTI